MKRSAQLLIHIGYWLIYLAIWGVVMAAISQGIESANEDLSFYFWLIGFFEQLSSGSIYA